MGGRCGTVDTRRSPMSTHAAWPRRMSCDKRYRDSRDVEGLLHQRVQVGLGQRCCEERFGGANVMLLSFPPGMAHSLLQRASYLPR